MSYRKFPDLSIDSPTLWPFVAMLVVFVLVFGTLGYSLIEGWPLFDSFYMTVITVATVGFSEIHPLNQDGRLFTIALIFLGVTVFVFATSAIAQMVLRQQIKDFFTGRRMENDIKTLNQHVVVCGYGRMCRAMVKDFFEDNLPVVAIDNNSRRIDQAKADGCLVVLGDASQEENLIKANATKARCLISLIPKDAENLYVAMAARELSPSLFIVCRAEDESAEKRLLKAGANRVISPYRVGGQKIARAVLKPYVSDLLELAAFSRNGNLQIEEIKVPLNSILCNMSIAEAKLRKNGNIMLLSLIKANGTAVFNPSAEEIFEAGMTVIAMGSKEDLEAFEKRLLPTSA